MLLTPLSPSPRNERRSVETGPGEVVNDFPWIHFPESSSTKVVVAEKNAMSHMTFETPRSCGKGVNVTRCSNETFVTIQTQPGTLLYSRISCFLNLVTSKRFTTLRGLCVGHVAGTTLWLDKLNDPETRDRPGSGFEF